MFINTVTLLEKAEKSTRKKIVNHLSNILKASPLIVYNTVYSLF